MDGDALPERQACGHPERQAARGVEVAGRYLATAEASFEAEPSPTAFTARTS
jgi:hypothetical protein